VTSRSQATLIPGMEVTISYDGKLTPDTVDASGEDEGESCAHRTRDAEEGYPLTDEIGGCMTLGNCRCGNPFCTGDLARAFRSHSLVPLDYHLLFASDTQVFVFMGRINTLNNDYLQAFAVKSGEPCPKISIEEKYQLIQKRYANPNDKENEIGAKRAEVRIENLYQRGNQHGKNIII